MCSCYVLMRQIARRSFQSSILLERSFPSIFYCILLIHNDAALTSEWECSPGNWRLSKCLHTYTGSRRLGGQNRGKGTGHHDEVGEHEIKEEKKKEII